MRKIIFLLLLPLFVCCSSDNKDVIQDYTSLTFEHHEPTILESCIVAYLNDKNEYIKIAELGDLGQNDVSKEVIISNAQIKEVYLFTISTRLNAIYKLKQLQKNRIILDKRTGGIGIENKTDPTEYPQ